MSSKTTAWVVVRLDGPAQEHADYISIKGVYDSQSDAQKAADKLSKERPAYEASYLLIPTRRLVGESREDVQQPARADRVQGLSFDKVRQENWNAFRFLPRESLKGLVDELPSNVKRQVVEPLMNYYAHLAVARALHGRLESANDRSIADIRLPDGSTVEVKVLFLDPKRERAPSIQLKSALPDYVALVIVRPDFELTTARLIPSEVIGRHERVGPSTREGRLVNLRITPDLMNAPGTSSIDLGPPALR